MTAINGMRFDEKSGMMLVDETRFWNDEWMGILTPDKTRLIVSEEMIEDLGIVACMGHTGTSSVGDEFMEETRKAVTARYKAEKERCGKIPKEFLSIEEIAHISWEVQCEWKRRHIDEGLKGSFGFTANDYIAGKYKSGERTVEIKEKSIIDEVHNHMTWEDHGTRVTGVFLNSDVIVGYSPKGGFRVFHTSISSPMCEAVAEIFLACGSGFDICDLVYSEYMSERSIPERRGEIDRVEGLYALMEGLNHAFRVAAGVTGYPKITYINGREKDFAKRWKSFSDKRSKLVSEVVYACMTDFLTRDAAYQCINDVVYDDVPWKKVEQDMWKKATNAKRLQRFFRGYKKF